MASRFSGRLSLMLVVLVCCSQALALDRGHQAFLDKGLQIESLAFPHETGYFDTARWAESNFTSVTLMYRSYLGPYPWDTTGPTSLYLPQTAPGIPWSRIMHEAEYSTNDISPWELPYVPNLVRIQLHDEQDISSYDKLSGLINIADDLHTLYPAIPLGTDQGGVSFSDEWMHNWGL